MARDMSDAVRDVLGNALSDVVKNIGDASPQKKGSSPFSGAKGLAAGAGLAAMVPLAKKGVGAVRSNGLKPGKLAPTKLASKAGEGVGGKLKEVASEKIDEAGGVGGVAKQAAGGLLPGGGESESKSSGGVPGVGKGRRMPVQQAVDVAVPVETAYNQFTQFEDWPNFMHRVTRVSQEDDCTIRFATKIWGKTKEYEAKIETQRPDERIKWKVSQGITHSGVVTFHELAPRLTRIEVNLDVEPGSLIEKAARGMRHIKRAVRADLHRYKAFIEMQELETGAWRGVIEDGELVEPHDESYDEERDYSEIPQPEAEEEGDEEASEQEEPEAQQEPEAEEEPEEEEEEQPRQETQRQRSQRFKRQAEGTRSRSRSGGNSSSRRRSPTRS